MEQEQETYLLSELLDEDEDLEQATAAVLGASDAQNCSYSKGYVKRQALYACITCNPPNSPDFVPSGICLACSYKCHENHEFIELYTKRNFRCDCGNKKFSERCCLTPDKDDYNEKNKYNHNFSGRYCTCERPYPDPDSTGEGPGEIMQQCCICEDWFHLKHSFDQKVNMEQIEEDGSHDFICKTCIVKVPTLGFYPDIIQKYPIIEVSKGVDADSGLSSLDSNETIPQMSQDPKADSKGCKVNGKVLKNLNDGTIVKNGWKAELCRCTECVKIYEEHDVAFLIDEEDSLEKYEAEGTANRKRILETQEGDFEKLIASLGHVGKIEAIYAFNDMKEKLAEFFKRMAETGEVVTEEHIRTFFNEMKENKRRKLENGDYAGGGGSF